MFRDFKYNKNGIKSKNSSMHLFRTLNCFVKSELAQEHQERSTDERECIIYREIYLPVNDTFSGFNIFDL